MWLCSVSAFYYLTIPWALPVAHICITGMTHFSDDFYDCDYDDDDDDDIEEGVRTEYLRNEYL